MFGHHPHHHDRHHDVVPPTYDIEMKGIFAWKLVLEYDNDSERAAAHTFTRARTSSYNSRIFSLALNSATLAYLRECNDVDLDHNDVFYEALSSEIAGDEEDARQINAMLARVRGGLEMESVSTETDTRTYTIEAQSTLSLYQRYFTAPGVHHDCDVYSVDDKMHQGAKTPVIISIKSQQVKFISGVSVVFAAGAEAEPIGAVHQYQIVPDQAVSSNINKDYTNKFAWLLPDYTLNKSTAASEFRLHVGALEPPTPPHDAAHGPPANHISENLSNEADLQDMRYLAPVVSDSRYKIYELALLRSPDGDALMWDPTWGYDGMTEDINGSRKGAPLYLAWKVRAAAL